MDPIKALRGKDALFLYSLDWRPNVCLSGKLVCLPAVVFSSLLSLRDHLNPGKGILSLSHQLLAVSYGVMDAYGDELLSNDLGQARSLEQTDNLAARVGEDWLDVVGLQVAHPLLYQPACHHHMAINVLPVFQMCDCVHECAW